MGGLTSNQANQPTLKKGLHSNSFRDSERTNVYCELTVRQALCPVPHLHHAIYFLTACASEGGVSNFYL